METKELKGNGKIAVARTEIYVPHLNESLAFSWPMEGPNHFKDVMCAIDLDKRLRPTTSKTFSLIDLALQNLDEKHCKDIISKFRNNYFWTSTENLWTPGEVIVYDNIDGKMPSDRESLIKRCKDGDKAIRIVPYGFKTEKQSIDEFLKNPYVIAQIGDKNMLDVVKRVAEGINKPYIWVLNKPQRDMRRYFALDSGGEDFGLRMIGDHGGRSNHGYASGVHK